MNRPGDSPDPIVPLILSRIPGLGPSRINTICRRFGFSTDVFRADGETFASLPGIGTHLASSITTFLNDRRSFGEAETGVRNQLALLDRYNAGLVTIDDPLYPPLLREIYDPPPCLFYRGDIRSAHAPCISVVGTRRATEYGRKAAALLCSELASRGFTVVSGLARGIDMEAHKAALESGGTTIGVLAGGVDNPYTDPAGKLWPRMIETGALLSEEWLESDITPAKFPKRNRLISGLSAGTLVVESDTKGGALITAASALEQNREVFAVPGSIFSRTSRGTNALIENSRAKLVASVEDILTEILPAHTPLQRLTGLHEPENLDQAERRILDHLKNEPLHVDLLAARTGLDPSALLVSLFELELKRLVEQQPGQMFRRRE